MGKEIECKLLAPGRAALDAVARDYGPRGDMTTQRLETVYYDLGPLAERGWMLRSRRCGGGPAVWAFKAPGEGYERQEFECRAQSPAEAVRALAAAGAPEALTGLETFDALCGASFTRRAILLEEGGATIELALDDGVLTAPGRSAPVCEVELELKAGPIAPMLALRDRLMAVYGLTEGAQGKFVRALALARKET